MSRYLVLTILILSIVGCGSGTPPATNTPSANAEDPTAVNMKAPEQKVVGTTTLADACDKAGMKPYPGSEKAEGDVLDRGNGEIKDEITFSTDDSVEKVGAFFKAQGLDSKNGPVAGNAMGMSKAGASVIVSFQSKGGKTEVIFKSVRAAEKAAKP